MTKKFRSKKERIEIVEFLNAYGPKATEEKYGINNSQVYVWRKMLKLKPKQDFITSRTETPRDRRALREENAMLKKILKTLL